jgi:hypothetical protein
MALRPLGIVAPAICGGRCIGKTIAARQARKGVLGNLEGEAALLAREVKPVGRRQTQPLSCWK